MLLPMFGMVVLTVVVAMVAVRHRFSAVRNKSVSIKYFRSMQGQDVPEHIVKSTRCFNNMFEIPVLFYVVCTLFIALELDSLLAVVLSWLFVIFRVVHTVIHLTYNNVVHRMLAFWSGIVTVLLLWIMLLLALP